MADVRKIDRDESGADAARTDQPDASVSDEREMPFHDPGTDDETADGLTETEDLARRGAEEVVGEAETIGDVPVFDRASAFKLQ